MPTLALNRKSWIPLADAPGGPFAQVKKSAGFRDPAWWIWCGSAIRGEDGLYHLFASRWDRRLPMSPNWLTNSEIVHAVSPRAEGPYEFSDVVFERRGPEFWDGRMTHNPTIHRIGDKYALFYLGTTFPEPIPTPENNPLGSCDPGDLGETPQVPSILSTAHRNQRIGVALADSPFGPWQRFDAPILEPRPGKWDSLITTNPAVAIRPDGRILLVYKSVQFRGGPMHLGVCEARDICGPYRRLKDDPIVDFDDRGDDLEDPCVWWADDHYEMLAKCMEGKVCNEPRAGLLFTSDDGIEWKRALSGIAYSRRLDWDDGTVSTPSFLDRPQVLIEDGRLTHILFATGLGSDNIGKITDSWNIAIPLKTDATTGD